MTTYLYAGSYREALDWCHAHDWNPRDRNLVVITTAQKLRGRIFHPEDEFVTYGTWSFRNDLSEVFNNMAMIGWEWPVIDKDRFSDEYDPEPDYEKPTKYDVGPDGEV